MSNIIQFWAMLMRLCYKLSMGHSRASKAETHARLVERAAARFNERGIDGISLADLMKDLKLTHGGFYRHFDSRDELVSEALQLALDRSSETMKDWLFEKGEPRVQRFVDRYLDEQHRDRRAEGCTVAALASDAARKSPQLQVQFGDNIERNIETLAAALKKKSAAEARAAAVLIICSLYGALIIARAVGDTPLSGEVLRTVRERAAGAAARAKVKSRPKRRASR
jgi:TetR/AcrR family transcriptional regulator, transcriptional repressor for nem operon